MVRVAYTLKSSDICKNLLKHENTGKKFLEGILQFDVRCKAIGQDFDRECDIIMCRACIYSKYTMYSNDMCRTYITVILHIALWNTIHT